MIRWTAESAVDVDGGGVDLLLSSGVTNSVTVLHNTGTAGANRFSVLRNRGAGVFQAAETSGLAVLPDGTLAFALAVGQFNDDNGDGLFNALDRPDIAVSNRRDQSLGGSPGSITVGLNKIVAGALNVELPAAQRSAAGLDFGLRTVDAEPTITALATPLRIVEDAAEQVIPLAGLSAGVGQSSQLFQVSVISS